MPTSLIVAVGFIVTFMFLHYIGENVCVLIAQLNDVIKLMKAIEFK